jgi:hypothetical protein
MSALIRESLVDTKVVIRFADSERTLVHAKT